jgi:hypothetical protein
MASALTLLLTVELVLYVRELLLANEELLDTVALERPLLDRTLLYPLVLDAKVVPGM